MKKQKNLLMLSFLFYLKRWKNYYLQISTDT